MMYLLVLYITDHVSHLAFCIRKGTISFLPRKVGLFVLHPIRRCLFEFSNEVRNTLISFLPDEKMEMVFDSSNNQRLVSQSFDRSPNVAMNFVNDFRLEIWMSILGTENDVAMKAVVSRRHNSRIIS